MARPPLPIYDRTIELQKFGTTEDEYGDTVEGFTSLGSVPARQRVARGSERLANAEIAATAPIVFYIRWAPQFASLDAKDRVVANGRTWNIVSAIEIGRRSEIEIAAIAAAD